jgi:hypothetical protein
VSSNRCCTALLLLTLLFLVSACGPPVLETSSKEDLEESLLKMKMDLDLTTTGQLESAISYLTEGAAFAEDQSRWDEVLSAYSSLQGMSARQIIVTAWNQECQTLEKRIRELEILLAEHQRNQELLAGLIIDKYRLFKPNPGFLDRPVIEVLATNGTDRELSKVQFRASLIKPGEPELLVDERIDQPVYRSFNRGSQIKMRIECQHALWRSMLASCKDCSFHFEVSGLLGSGNATLASTDFGAFEKSQLARFRGRLSGLQTSGPPLGSLAN